MPPRLTPEVAELLRVQGDVIAVWQLGPAQRRAARRAVRCGHWQGVTDRVFLAAHRPIDASVRSWAAVLHCGPKAGIAGKHALILHGWRAEPGRHVDVAVPAASQPRNCPEWMRVHRLRSTRIVPHRPPRVGVHDAACQAASWARSDREAVFIILSCLQQRLTTPDRLIASMGSNVARRRLMTHMCSEFKNGIHSTNEYDFAGLCRRHGLPQPSRQVLVRDARGVGRAIDVEFEVGGRTLRVEIEGVHHVRPEAWLDDIERHNDIVLTGAHAYLRVSTITLRLGPDRFMRVLAAMIDRLRRGAM